MFWNKSLIARLTTSFLVLSLAVAGIAGVVAFVQATNALEDSVVERLRLAALSRQAELDMWVSTQANDLAFISRWGEVLEPASTIRTAQRTSLEYQVAFTSLDGILRDVVVSRPDFEELFILDDNGVVLVASRRTSRGQNLGDNQYYMAGRSQTFIQNVYPDPQSGRPTMTIATPLLDPLGRRLGVLAVHLNLDRMDSIILDRMGLGETGEMYLVDRTGLFVSSQRFGRHDQTDQITSDGIQRALAGASGTGRYLNYRGIPVIGAYQWLDNFELALLVEIQQQEAFAPTNQLAIEIAVSGIVSASILVFGISLLARQIARPILQLTAAAHEVAAGNLHAKAPVLTKDEIGVLARVFNQMVAELHGLYERMEHKVAQRTAELTEANAHLTSEIVERQRVEEQLVHAKEQAEAANRAKEHLSGQYEPRTAHAAQLDHWLCAV
ncbi:MAG: HAMP domain-containing protein [Blastochloris sp.]|nr:HAMP domain-containing protein [Blastochloris sp.]